METKHRKVIAAVIDTTELTLYHPDGSETIIKQGDPRLAPIVQLVNPICSRGAIAEVPEEMFFVGAKEARDFHNTFNKFEEQSNGLVKFYRIAKKKFKGWFGNTEEEEPVVAAHYPDAVIGMVPGTSPVLDENVVRNQTAVEQIMENAIPSSSPEFNRPTVSDEETTVVAVIGDQIIPSVETLHGQFKHANESGQKDGAQALMARMGAMTEKRAHPLQDLLRFLERGDLPVDKNGDIIVFKKLRREGDHYVDCHTGRVKQRLGSLVQMDPKLVDHDRRVECSQGLHIARRDYIRQFSGDVCVIAKLRPEAVIAVPVNDPDKMRVCEYHIVAELSAAQFQLINNGKSITQDPDGAKLLARIIDGDHIGIIEDVVIGGPKGTNVTVTARALEVVEPVLTTQPEVAPVHAIDIDTPAVPTIENVPKAAAVDPRQVSKDAMASKPQVDVSGLTLPPEAPQPPTTPYPVAKDTSPKMASEARQREAKKLYDAWRDATSEKGRKNALQKLKDFKGKARVSWEALGIENPATVELPPIAKATRPGTEATRAVVPPPKPDPLGLPPGFKPAASMPSKLTLAEQARIFVINKDGAGLAKFKKERKKSYESLGISDDELEKLNITK